MINTKTVGRQKQDDYKEAVVRKYINRNLQSTLSISTRLDANVCVLLFFVYIRPTAVYAHTQQFFSVNAW